ncbi:hypothetical protein FACS1894102_7770 [Spirochaetia bacterium]|nr:hypothetical protein FACS1894102_7770 [Spirochaetia bacterium]
MGKNINFEDNIFILNTKIRGISDLLLLDADPDMFLDRTIGDLEFISTSIGSLLGNLAANKLLISRDEQIHNLNETVQVFLDILSNMLRGNVSFSVRKFHTIEDVIKSLINNSNEQLKLIDGYISEMDKTSMAQGLVTNDEMTELLKNLTS